MITSPVQHHDENDDEDLDQLRKIAMESLKRGRENEFPQEHQINHPFPNVQPVFGSQPEIIPFENEIPYPSASFPPNPRMPRMGGNPHFMRPRFNNFGPRHHGPSRPFMPHRMPHQFPPQPVIPDFVPIPHVNPQFLAQQQPPPPLPQPQIFPPVNNEFPLEFVPTPAIRLSPRSAEFIAANEQAIMKASAKRYSRSPPPRRRRSRSVSPVRRRSRSRSPYKQRRSPNDNNIRKRYRSKSPENRPFKSRNNSPKIEKRSRSPRNRSQSPRNARFARKGRDNNNRFNNGNGRFNRKRSESDKEEDRAEPNRSQSKPKDESTKEKADIDTREKIEEKKEVKVVETKSLTPAPEEKSTTPPLLPERKEKTQEELEDELLASTDEEDGDQLDINMDDNELDFLEDDSESENEGRFKSKSSSNNKSSSSSLPSKSNFSSRSHYDKGKYSSSRNDYRRDDKYSNSKRKDHASRKITPDLDSRRKSPTERKTVVLSKDKDDSKNSTESERKPMFKSTFKSIDSGEKKAESTAAKKIDSRPSLVRSYVNKPDSVEKKTSSVKSVITLSEESSRTGSKKKIMERLGEFVGAKGKVDGNRSRASKQVVERRRVVLKINSAVEENRMASKNSCVST